MRIMKIKQSLSILLLAESLQLSVCEIRGGSFQRLFVRPSPPPTQTAVEDSSGGVESRLAQLEQKLYQLSAEVPTTTTTDGKLYKSNLRQDIERELHRLAREIQGYGQQSAFPMRDAPRSSDLVMSDVKPLGWAAENIMRIVADEAEYSIKRKLAEIEEAVAYKASSFFDRLFFGKPAVIKTLVSETVVHEIQSALRVMVLLSSLANLSFKKNILVGAFEFISFILLVGSSQKHQIFFATLGGLVLERVYLFHTTHEIWQMAVSGAIAGLALTLLVNDIVMAMRLSMGQATPPRVYGRYPSSTTPPNTVDSHVRNFTIHPSEIPDAQPHPLP